MEKERVSAQTQESKESDQKTEEEEVRERERAPRPLAVIVGASSGIGMEIASALVQKGYAVVNISRNLCCVERVKNITADIAQGEELERAIKAAGEEGGRIAFLIYSAGTSMAAPIESSREADIRYLFEVNYFGAVRALRSVLPYMKEKGGRVLFISSLGSLYPIPFDSFYSSSKAALDMLARGARVELKRYKISLTCVEAGGTSTSFTFKRKVYPEEANGAYAKDVQKSVAALANMEQGGMEPKEVAREIVDELFRKYPSITFVPGTKNKVFRAMYRLLPEKWTAYFNDKRYNQ